MRKPKTLKEITPECCRGRNWEIDSGIFVAHFWRTKSYLYKVGGSYFEYFWPDSEHVHPDSSRCPISAFCITSHWSILRMFFTIWKWIANLTLLQINWSVHLVLTIELSSSINSQSALATEALDITCNLGMVEEIHVSSRFYLWRFSKKSIWGQWDLGVSRMFRAMGHSATGWAKVKSLARSYRKMLFKD